jgi:hypothetical protein
MVAASLLVVGPVELRIGVLLVQFKWSSVFLKHWISRYFGQIRDPSSCVKGLIVLVDFKFWRDSRITLRQDVDVRLNVMWGQKIIFWFETRKFWLAIRIKVFANKGGLFICLNLFQSKLHPWVWQVIWYFTKFLRGTLFHFFWVYHLELKGPQESLVLMIRACFLVRKSKCWTDLVPPRWHGVFGLWRS